MSLTHTLLIAIEFEKEWWLMLAPLLAQRRAHRLELFTMMIFLYMRNIQVSRGECNSASEWVLCSKSRHSNRDGWTIHRPQSKIQFLRIAASIFFGPENCRCIIISSDKTNRPEIYASIFAYNILCKRLLSQTNLKNSVPLKPPEGTLLLLRKSRWQPHFSCQLPVYPYCPTSADRREILTS